jgi:hypothetical protein
MDDSITGVRRGMFTGRDTITGSILTKRRSARSVTVIMNTGNGSTMERDTVKEEGIE